MTASRVKPKREAVTQSWPSHTERLRHRVTTYIGDAVRDAVADTVPVEDLHLPWAPVTHGARRPLVSWRAMTAGKPCARLA